MVFALFLALLWTHPATAQTQQQLQEIESALKQTEKKLGKERAQRERTLNSLQDIEQQIAERSLRYESTRSKTEIMDGQAKLLETERTTLADEIEDARSKLAILLESAYLMGRQSGLKVVLSQQKTQDIARFNQYALSLSDARQNQIDALQSLRTQLADKNRQLDKQRQQLEKLSAALEEDKRYLAQLKRNRQKTIRELDQAIASNNQALDHLKTRKARLEKVLAEISQRQRARAARKRAQQKRLQAIKNLPPRQEKQIVPIRGQGKLPLPVRATITNSFGDVRQSSGLPWSGVMMEGLDGSEIRAIEDGEVVYADWLQGYGQLLIVDHGQGVMSLYGHTKRIHRTVGDLVKQSDIIAHMGNTAGLKKPALYFEIRKDGIAQDPLKWCRSS